MPYEDAGRRKEIDRHFGIKELPTLLVLNKSGVSVIENAIEEVENGI